MVKHASAQTNTIPVPSVPQFTLQVINESEVPANDWINPVAGLNEQTKIPSNETVNCVIVLTIKNQPFTSYIYSGEETYYKGENISFFYNVRLKEHFSENWTTIYSYEGFPYQSKNNYTVLLFPVTNTVTFYYNDSTLINSLTTQEILAYYWQGKGYLSFGSTLTDIPLQGGQVDFQVEAMIGTIVYFENIFPNFSGQISGWSNTQTITIPASSTSTSPTVSEFPILTILLVFIVLSLFSTIVLAKKQPSKIAKLR